MEQVKIELVGLLPTVYNLCAKCNAADYMKAGGINYLADQLKDYSPETLQEQDRAAQIYYNLLRDFGERVIPLAVGLTSFRGLWLAWKHRLGNEFSIVINGRRVIKGDADYQAIKQAVQEELILSEV
ncbi:MAG: hypothetical protein ACK4Z6_01275 [Candidatus Methylomirabilales bacterium]